MDNFKFIKSLDSVNLILGNGFDLHCKLHCSYKNYHQKYKQKYDFLISLIDKYFKLTDQRCSFFDNTSLKKTDFKKCNLWDFFFALSRKQRSDSMDYNWCDVESLMQDSLVGVEGALLSWPRVFSIYKYQSKVADNGHNEDLMAGIIYLLRDKKPFKDEREYYDFLLKELFKFESVFGRFILNQRKNIDRNHIEYGIINKRYLECAKRTLGTICNFEKIISIDIFNYDEIGIGEYDSKTNMINGNYNNPIFGVNSVFKHTDPRFIFTKTHRHIFDNMHKTDTKGLVDFKNIVVFGHSLCEYDFMHFFSAFDKIRISDPTNTSCFIYVFSVYDESKRTIIENDVRNSVYNLIYSYAAARELHTNLLSALDSQNRLRIVELKDHLNEFNYESHFDDSEYKNNIV